MFKTTLIAFAFDYKIETRRGGTIDMASSRRETHFVGNLSKTIALLNINRTPSIFPIDSCAVHKPLHNHKSSKTRLKQPRFAMESGHYQFRHQ
jgi:hypothetical protein